MPRYYFIVAYGDRQIGDPIGQVLQDDANAIDVASKIIDDLSADHERGTPKPTIVVKKEGEVVYQFPGIYGFSGREPGVGGQCPQLKAKTAHTPSPP